MRKTQVLRIDECTLPKDISLLCYFFIINFIYRVEIKSPTFS